MSPVSTKVLLVDDDELLRDMYARKFRERGCEVEALGSAQEGLERLRAGAAFDLVVFDIVMPGLDGFGFLEAMRSEHLAEGAGKVALTNQSADEDRERAIGLGASSYLIKASITPTEAVDAALTSVGRKG